MHQIHPDIIEHPPGVPVGELCQLLQMHLVATIKAIASSELLSNFLELRNRKLFDFDTERIAEFLPFKGFEMPLDEPFTEMYASFT